MNSRARCPRGMRRRDVSSRSAASAGLWRPVSPTQAPCLGVTRGALPPRGPRSSSRRRRRGARGNRYGRSGARCAPPGRQNVRDDHADAKKREQAPGEQLPSRNLSASTAPAHSIGQQAPVRHTDLDLRQPPPQRPAPAPFGSLEHLLPPARSPALPPLPTHQSARTHESVLNQLPKQRLHHQPGAGYPTREHPWRRRMRDHWRQQSEAAISPRSLGGRTWLSPWTHASRCRATCQAPAALWTRRPATQAATRRRRQRWDCGTAPPPPRIAHDVQTTSKSSHGS